MRSILRVVVSSLALLLLAGSATFVSAAALGNRDEFTPQWDPQYLATKLQEYVRGQNLITFEAPTRWSTFGAPRPAIVVNPRNEQEVALAVSFLAAHGIPFVAQNGGNGWATTFNLGPGGVLINLARLDSVTFNSAKTQATIGGGANINKTIAAAYKAGTLVETGNCNCVGTLGAILGGGYGNLMGLYGFGVDNVISLRVVTPDGKLRTVTASSDPDLFWALRGAGPNFGIVTSAVVKAYPAKQTADMTAWAGALIFSSDKLERVVQAIQDLKLEPEMNIFMYFISGGADTGNSPVVMTTPFLNKGTPELGRQKFASLFAIGPMVDTTSVLPYNQWNSGGDGFCIRGFRKPSFSVGMQELVPSVWRRVWNEYVSFQSRPGAESSAVLMEAYSLDKAKSIPGSSAAFPYRDVKFHAVSIGWYNDTGLDGAALETGRRIRELWRGEDGLGRNATYVNFAHGDETLDVVYGDSLARLKTIKKKVDPLNRFNQWFNIK